MCKYLFDLRSQWLGLVPYNEGLQLQDTFASSVRGDSQKAIVLGLEHPPVITLGIRGHRQTDIASSEATLIERGIPVFRIQRGGQATFHSPGQLVIYPILPLREWRLGVRHLVNILTEATQACLLQRGISTQSGQVEPGLYTERGKIAFFGLKIDRGVSSHGLAINVSNDLALFQCIRSCGTPDQPMDSVSTVSTLDHPDSMNWDLQAFFMTWFYCFVERLENCQPGFAKSCLA